MARAKSTPVRGALSRMFPKAMLQRLAVSEGVVRRRRRVDAVALFWVMVLTLDTGRKRRIADLRRSYAKTTGVGLSASSFHKRLSPALARWLKKLVSAALDKTARATPGAGPVLGKIRDVLCVDSTVVRVHDALARVLPACRTNHTLAAAKLHTVLNVRGKGPQSVKLTAETVHDGPVLRAGSWVRGRLLLFDLGYFRYQLFAALARNGGYWLTRLKDNANPEILWLHRPARGQAARAEGKFLQEIKDQITQKVFDAEVQIRFRRRAWAGRRHGATLLVRIVGLRDDVHGGYHWYITNLPEALVPAEDIGKLYGARWSIELLFRELKGCYQLESLPSRKPYIVEALLYAAVLTLVASRALLAAVRRFRQIAGRRIPLERWAHLVVSAAAELLAIVLDPLVMARQRERRLIPFLVAEAPDPNVNRPLLLQRAGLPWAA